MTAAQPKLFVGTRCLLLCALLVMAHTLWQHHGISKVSAAYLLNTVQQSLLRLLVVDRLCCQDYVIETAHALR